MSDKKKTSWMIWGAAALLLMLVAYPLSVGPVFALVSNPYAESLLEAAGPTGENAADLALTLTYWPLERLSECFPDSIGSALQIYVDWWTPQAAHAVTIPISAPLPAPPIPPPLSPTDPLSGGLPGEMSVDQPSPSGLPISQ